MSIINNSIMTWSDLTATVVSSIASICCNVDSFASNVPARLRSGQGQVAVYTTTTQRAKPQRVAYETWTYYANPSNLISTVASSTISAEWNNFCASAGINISHNGKVIQGKELGDLIGLYMQFMAGHVKPIYSNRKIYNTIDGGQSTFQGCKYVAGTIIPDYSLTSISPSNIPIPSNSDVNTIISHDFAANRLFTRHDDPKIFRSYLS